MDREMSVIEKADAKWRVIAVAPLPGDDECRPDCKKLPTTAEKKRVLASDEFRNTGSLIPRGVLFQAEGLRRASA